MAVIGSPMLWAPTRHLPFSAMAEDLFRDLHREAVIFACGF